MRIQDSNPEDVAFGLPLLLCKTLDLRSLPEQTAHFGLDLAPHETTPLNCHLPHAG